MSAVRPQGRFPSTRWSLVRRIKSPDDAVAAIALNEICAAYHYPLYCYLRRRGCAHHDAQDVLHDFLASLIRLKALEHIEEERGRLRGYLATAIANHLRNWRLDDAKREQPVAEFDHLLDFDAAENRYRRERFTDADTPERIFEKKWAAEIIRQTMENLAARYERKGLAALCTALRPVVLKGGTLRGEDLPALAAKLGMGEETVRKALSRMMARFRQELESAVRATVEDSAAVGDELAYLRGLFAP